MRFPDPCAKVMESLSFLNFEIFKFIPLDCLVRLNTDYFADLLFSTLAPVAFSFLLLAIGLVAKARAKASVIVPDAPTPTRANHTRNTHHPQGGASSTGITNTLTSIFLLITFLALPSCSKKIFATFKCNSYVADYEDEEPTVEISN